MVGVKEGPDFEGPGVVDAPWWRPLPDGRIQCDLCPRDCRLHEGQRGLCFVRAMHQGRMVARSRRLPR